MKFVFWFFVIFIGLTHEYMEHLCVFSTVATDAPVLKHQTISTHIADQICIAFDQFYRKVLHWD